MPRDTKGKRRRSTASGRASVKGRTREQRPELTPADAVKAWVQREVREQERRYRRIVAEMEALAPLRERWIEEFYERIQTRGYSVHAGIRRRIRPEEIPPRPRRKLRVVY
jgi:hypothetical protein